MDVVARYERSSGGHIGVYAKNIVTGETLAWRPDERFVMCSTFKASLAACVLSLCDQGHESLDRQVSYGASDIQDWYAPVAKAHLAGGSLSVRELCAGAVEQSDNSCANILLARIGGPAALTAFWRRLGDRETRLDNVEPVLNRTPPGGINDTTTPASMTGIMQTLVLGDVLSAASRRILTTWLVGCRTGANRLRAGFPPHWVVGDKTGNNGSDAAGDIAVIWPRPQTPLVMSVYTRGGTPTEGQLREAFAGIAHLAARLLVVSEHAPTPGDRGHPR